MQRQKKLRWRKKEADRCRAKQNERKKKRKKGGELTEKK